MSDPQPRYVTTRDELWILDRWYNHREVYRAPHYENEIGGYRVYGGTREATRKLCAEWNAEHDAWLAAG